MKCKKCKRVIDNDLYIFCPWCGTRQKAEKTDDGIPEPEQLPSGSWRVRIVINGKRKSFTAQTKKECIALARDAKNAPAQNESANITLKEAVTNYIEEREKILSPSTIRSYKQIKENFLPELMEYKVCDITPSLYQVSVNSIAADYSPKSLRNGCGLINSAAKKVCGVTLSCDLPKKEAPSHAFLEPDQIGPFMEYFKDSRTEAAVLLGLSSLRLSEILGLQPSDYKKGVIHVHAAMVKDENNKLVRKETTKTASSTRDVPIMIPRLKELLPDALPIELSQQNIYWDIKLACEQLGIENIGVHGLRHSFASLAAHLQMPEKQAMSIGGWSSPQILREIYTHVADADRIKAQNKMQDFYSNGHEMDTKK